MSATSHIENAQERQQRRIDRLESSRSGKRRLRRLVVVLAAIVVLLAACVAWLILLNRGPDRVAAGVKVGGVALAGMTEPQARRALRDWLESSGVTGVRLHLDQDTVKRLTLDRLGINMDVEATVRRALEQGRHRVGGLVLWRGDGGEVQPVVKVVPHVYKRGLSVIRDEVDRPAKDASLRLRGKRVQVVPDKNGLTIDDITLERRLLRSLAVGESYDGDVPTVVVTPEVTTLDAQARRAAAARYLERPLLLRLGGHRIRLRPAKMAGMLAVTSDYDSDDRPLTFDNQKSRDRLRRLFRNLTTPAKDATVKIRRGEVLITRSREGRGVDMDRLTADMDAAAAGRGLRTVHVSLITVYPRHSTTQLQAMGLDALGSRYTTYYSPRNKARAANIARAATLVNGTIVRPGTTFSLNETLGPRTQNRGFDSAPVIVDGVLRQGVGGGICQYATTLFNAVFFAGLPIEERHAHTFAIGHYPLGRDASVAWGSQDLRFRNNTRQPLMIRSFTTRGAITVILVGRTGRTVTYTTGEKKQMRQPQGTERRPRVIYDQDTAGGLVTLEQGSPGYTITVRRTVRAGSKVVFRDRFVSRYAPRDWVKRIGTRQ